MYMSRIHNGETKIDERAMVVNNIRITTEKMMTAVSMKWIMDDVEEIENRIRKFERMVWFGTKNLQSIVNGWQTRGHEAQIDDMTVLFGGTAGRLLITRTMRQGGHMVTLIANETGGSGVGLQGIDTTKTIAIEMIENFINAWYPFRKLEIKENSELMII